MWQLLSQDLGAIPHRLWWDNESGIGRRGRLTDPVTAFVGTAATTLIQLKPKQTSLLGFSANGTVPVVHVCAECRSA